MPSAAARRLYEDQIPSFMSVFDIESEAMDDRGAITVVDSKMMDIDPPETKLSGQQQPLHPAAVPSDPLHKHHDSTSTQNAGSADSSPTTTASCTDSSSLSDQSPSSSPESPINNLIPLSSFPGPTFGGLPSMASLTVSEPTQRPMTSPGPRRPRNMKGLSIQPPFTNSLSSRLVSEPSSPVFIKPAIPAMKRKPSQLSLKTSSQDLHNKPATVLEVPSSPTLSIPPILQRRALKHSTSSPHMLSTIKSATFGPAGGMTIPTVLERNESGLSEFLRPSKPPAPPPTCGSTIHEEESPIRAQVANRAAFDFEPYHEVENNEDQKSPGYPNGPIAIYRDDVFLFSEPSAEVASRFDVVINVAREVHNPFHAKATPPDCESPVPDTAVTTASFSTAFEYPLDDAATPTTPKALSPVKQPEYIHMPWDHNTDIAPDLMNLCETIDRKTREGKKVLVHCQQGASRSASLIIAYGMYQNPELSVNDAYYAAQAKSRWISPNMRLMYCLQDFQKEVSRRRLTPASALRPRVGKSPTNHRVAHSVDAIALAPKEPLTAPLPDEGDSARSPEKSPLRARGASTPGQPISPGPSSAPSSFTWSEKEDERDPGKFGRFNIDHVANLSEVAASRDSSSPIKSTLLQMPSSSLGFEAGSSSRPPPSPGFAPSGLGPAPFSSFAPPASMRPPPSPGFAPSLAPLSLSKPSSSHGLAPIELSMPPRSPGFAPPSFGQPPPSPGFGAHRLQKKSDTRQNEGLGGFAGFSSLGGFVPLSMDSAPQQARPENRAPTPSATAQVSIIPAATFADDDALMSPRVETMTSNPLHHAPFPGSDFGGMRLVEVPPTPDGGLFSPRETMFPRDPFRPFARPPQVADPRSPPTKGETPIVRSIDELL
ncbi:tyrosine-protein phosphatase pmp1 [Magnaporthiopsis poae ATCC 64411]|uniref:protein-tyrosine-phosphatase n=1 Tax=Magnaporthiopsis poae (strain ATCC 64411 / 73-15) TaxID=644358 RepID=A0A0C4DKS8_MAGP6|nr:tyrosine-protein phosphatase pmp1 [Magnaporthiopsis poae ATCC 64411]